MKKLLFILILFCSLQGFGQIKGMWRMDGNSNDASGNGNNGTDTNITYSQANGRLNQGGSFNGTTSKIIKTSSASLNIAGVITLSAWINIPSLPSEGNFYSIIYKEYVSPSNSIQYFMDINTSSGNALLRCGCFDAPGGNITYNADYIINSSFLNKWNHIVGLYDGSYWRLYVNGILVSSALKTKGALSIAANIELQIGSLKFNGSYSRFFNGAIDEVIIDNTAWSPAKVKNYYLLTSPKFSF